MKKLFVGSAFAAFALGSAPVAAQPAPPPPGVAQGTTPLTAPMHHTPPIVRSPVRVRVTGTAVMTRDDFVRHVRAAFADLDANRDGFVTRREVAALHDRMMQGMHGMHAATAESLGAHPQNADDHGMAMRDPTRMFDRLDTNHDGVISRQEFMAAHARMHERRMVMMRGRGMMPTGDDMGSMGGHMSGMGENHGMHFFAHLFDTADVNHDGRVTLKEAETAALAHFDQMDTNHDGRLTPDERRNMHAMMRERPPR